MIMKALWARTRFFVRAQKEAGGRGRTQLLNSRVLVAAKAVNTTMSRYGNFLPLVQNEKKRDTQKW